MSSINGPKTLPEYVPECIKEGRDPSVQRRLWHLKFSGDQRKVSLSGDGGVHVWNCYFSPNDPFEVFERQILLLDENLSEAVGRVLIVGNFKGKSPECGETWLDRREILIGKMFARNDMFVLNRGREGTLIGSIIDFTIAMLRLA